jgi:hypothetical protein
MRAKAHRQKLLPKNIIFYFMLKEQKPYEHVDAQRYQEQFREREVKNLQRKAAKLGFALDPLPA